MPTSAHAATVEKSADEIVSAMSEEEKIEQLLMPDFRQWKDSGQTAVSDMTVLSDEVKQILQKYKFGGIILFANNVKQTEQTVRLTDDLQKANAEGGNIPLLIATDQEGGSVVRLGSGCRMTGNMALGATRDEQAAFDTGDIMGSELRALGINVDYAPVMDTNDNPKNPVIGLRSFSDDPQLVAKLGIQVMKGLQSNNIATALKHFPGHGNTATDSHTGMPVVNKTMEQLEKVELAPFQAAIDAGADIIMTTHIQYPNIITEELPTKNGGTIKPPATLSKQILTGLLRDKMGFDGVVVTDAMNMQGITDNFNEPEATLYAIKAGADMVVMPTILRSKADVPNKLDPIIEKIKTEAKTDEELQNRIEESAKRIVQLKIDRDIMTLDETPIDEKIANAEAVVGSEEHHDREREIADEAVTVIKNDNHVLPIKPKENQKFLLIGQYSNELPALQFGLEQLINEGKINTVQFKTMHYYPGNYTDEQFEEAIKDADYVIAITETTSEAKLDPSNWVTSTPTKIVNWSKQWNKPCVLVSIDKPYDVANYPNADTMLAVYGSSGMDPTEGGKRPTTNYGPNIPAALDIIFGAFDPVGTLPVNIPVITNGVMSDTEIQYPRGYGLTGPLTLDKTELLNAVTNAENLYPNNDNGKFTSESWAAFTTALANAKSVLENNAATQADIDTAKNALNTAIQNLQTHHKSRSDDSSRGTSVISSTATFQSDTNADFFVNDVNGSYVFKITSLNGQIPNFVIGTAGVFTTQLIKVDGNDYYFKITASGTAGAQAGIYVNGVKIATVTVGNPAGNVKSDTTLPFHVKAGASYVFKLTADTKPTFVTGNASVFKVEFVKAVGNDYYYRVIAIGKAGQAAGFYINSSKTPVTVATIA
ncbi:MAG TPA: beta-hexosaminidase [Clostridiales bacterium]|nr:beta-hexosaminidase [Clostridiales bacterium]